MPRKLKKPLQTGTPAERQAQKTARREERAHEIRKGVLPKTSKAREKLRDMGDEERRNAFERREKLSKRDFKITMPEKGQYD